MMTATLVAPSPLKRLYKLPVRSEGYSKALLSPHAFPAKPFLGYRPALSFPRQGWRAKNRGGSALAETAVFGTAKQSGPWTAC